MIKSIKAWGGELAMKTQKEKLEKMNQNVGVVENLAEGIDANTVIKNGLYRIVGNGNEENFPISANGFLKVDQYSSTYIIQEYIHYNRRSIYKNTLGKQWLADLETIAHLSDTKVKKYTVWHNLKKMLK